MKAKKLGCGCLVIFLAFLGIVFFMGLLISSASEKRAQEELNYRQTYIAETEKLAVRVAKKYDLLPSVMIAQSILESNWGRSELSQEYNNYFGIKAVKKDDGIAFETEEYVEGQSGRYMENFKKYSSKKESFDHYGKLLSTAKRYKKVKTAKNYKEAAQFIKEGGYATDPAYAEKIISVIEKYGLEKYDEV
ncbi:glycoside hydrolase family 73 protein [Peptoniphilus harei]|uniref:glycoside hydrolase family 73 protein n=1 Tax=Peptoniphilus TaxID=162289 RepID=UPI00254EFE72|nr:glycoside hydrolase family 73 protein [Peptoniphilus harei]MDK7376976.1 glycoside hydrolase family 73 protein [Peptoniphilus harei]MDK7678556.1 glycoside hydrolase family 73 protein [Peptoniphilus harei]MDU5184014.1 glycoside hydrolase family 73 protein [Peptoniphilus harei]